MPQPTAHIGIVGCSAEGAALCYRTVCLEGGELLGRDDHPEVTLHTHSLARYMVPIHGGDWGQERDDSVAQLYGPSIIPGSRPGSGFHIFLSQWRFPAPWPYHVMQFKIPMPGVGGPRDLEPTGRTAPRKAPTKTAPRKAPPAKKVPAKKAPARKAPAKRSPRRATSDY